MAGLLPKKSHLRSFLKCSDSFLFQYETPRLVTVRSARIGIIYRVVQACIISYLIGYVFVYTKSYQEFDLAESSVVSKIKGLMYARGLEGRKEIWDSIDFVVPAQESDAFFIATSMVLTVNQSQEACPEDPNVSRKGVWCETDADCTPGQPTPGGNGRKTGRCVNWDKEIKTCEVNAWCPTETDKTPKKPILHGLDSVTVLVKNHIAFPKFGIKRRNILDSINQTYLQSCRYNRDTDPLCPIFNVKDMIMYADEDVQEISTRGGILGFTISWNCNFDFDQEQCIPVYSFRRLDDKNAKIAKGWNFRTAHYYYDYNGTTRRDLVKLWGIRFVFNVNGRAGKFSPVNFLLNLGSGIGLLGIASVVCEFVLLNCVRSNDDLLEQKFTNLEQIKTVRRQSAVNLSSLNLRQLDGSNNASSARLDRLVDRDYLSVTSNHIYANTDYSATLPRRHPPIANADEI
ncbi:P2X purinoceptor 4-like isoform X2 [Paramacrobiotus metropolitanus]|uniref:P2X purinoceptor 4-like isoform X2 n=1 Tax=Paramacrobiotus metropolitanus TaxID=2943436 RepID=UPI0024462730|nr:P2X purinoceptor 4-like isoform X2 [Paramacrobiotus metropolitanus]